MKLTVNKEQIIEGLLKAAAIIPAKAGAQYLRSIWLKAEEGSLSVMSTDANIEFTGRYPAEVAAPGLIGVQGRAFVDLVRQLPTGVLHLTLDEASGNLLLEQGRRTYKLPVSGAEWFQNFSAFPAEYAVTWSGDFLQDILDKVGFCISDDDAMDAIACLCMKPRLMLLDEPASGLNTQEAFELGRTIQQLNKSEIIIVVIEHNMALVRQIADRVIHFESGRVKYALGQGEWLGQAETD